MWPWPKNDSPRQPKQIPQSCNRVCSALYNIPRAGTVSSLSTHVVPCSSSSLLLAVRNTTFLVSMHRIPVALLKHRIFAGDALLCLHNITQFPHEETPTLSLSQHPPNKHCLENRHWGTSRCVLMLSAVSSLMGPLWGRPKRR